MTFTKTLAAALTALTLGSAALASSVPAEAGWGCRRGCGGAVAAGIIGGLAIGAIAASSRPAYAEPVYAESECYLVKRRYVNAWGEVVIRHEQVC
jgi:hypothetical protein